MIILFGGKEYAVGLSWFSISSPGEIDQFKHEMELTHGVVKLSKIEGMPSAVALSPSEYSNQVSLAAALSYAHDNLLYVCKTEYKDEAGRQLYYLCCVKRGVVTVDGDTMGDVDTIAQLHSQFLMDLKNDIPEDKIDCLGTDVDDRFESAQPIDASQIVTSIQRFESQCVIKELKKKGISKLAIGLMAVACVGLLYLGYQQFLKPAPPPPPVAKAPAPPPDPFVQFMNSVTIGKTTTSAALPHIADEIRHIPFLIKGWSVTDITINLGATTRFTLTFVRTPFATMKDLESVAASGVITDLNIDSAGESAKAVWGREIQNMPLLTRQTLETLKTTAKLQNQKAFMDIFQSNKIIIKLDNTTEIGGFSSRRFSYGGKGIWGLDGFNDMFHVLPTMGITMVNVKPNKGEYDWSLEGDIYG